jgi:hypothetical protein
MRTRSFCITSLLAASVALAVIACTPDATAPADVVPEALVLDKRVKDLENKYGWIGKYHTDGLEFVYAQLARSEKKDLKTLCKVVDRAVRDFHKAQRKGDIPFHLMDPSIFAGACDDLKGNNRGGSKNLLPRTTGISANEVSPLTVSYIDQIETAVYSATTKAALLNSLLNIQNAAVATLPLDEAGVVIGTVSVVISSMEYWQENLEAWINLGAGPGIAYSIDAASIPGVSAQTGFWPRYWTNPFMQAFKKVMIADGMAAARVLYSTWRLGPIGWDAAAAAGVFASITTAISLQF